MPVSTIIVLAAMVAVFAAYAATLAWAQLQTHHITSAEAASRPKKRPF
jgi:hypothetical protein